MIFGVLSFHGIGMASQNRGIIYTSRRPILFPRASGKFYLFREGMAYRAVPNLRNAG